MLRVRTTKTSSLATAIQVVRYEGKKTVVIKHVGSGKSKEAVSLLKEAARHFIETSTGQQRLFQPEQADLTGSILQLDKCEYLGVRHTFIYDVIVRMFALFGFDCLGNNLLLDIVLMRIIEPSSKRQAITLLRELFGIDWPETDVYRGLRRFALVKETVEKTVMAFAKKNYGFDFSLVFYDTTTLYFESFKEDEEEFRKPGFSKDNKFNQPQIVIGLMVTKEGFPVAYEVFAGNTFEGKTFIPAICKFKDTYAVTNLTVVADAAMISLPNIRGLVEHNLTYIVGARVASLALSQIKEISQQLNQTDGSAYRIETKRGLLVCDFSLKRYRKDKREMEKQIQKAEKFLGEHKGVKRTTKFLKNRSKTKQMLNTALIEKTTALLGIKGYYTNLTDTDDKIIISHYHNLWRVEQAFRMAKSDLAMRPIYHFKKQTVEAHILICFMALAVCKYMELKTGRSIKKIVRLLKSITEARILNKLTGEIIVMRQIIPEDIKQLWKTLSRPY